MEATASNEDEKLSFGSRFSAQLFNSPFWFVFSNVAALTPEIELDSRRFPAFMVK